MRSHFAIALVLALAAIAPNESTAQTRAEFRGVWVSRFDWVSADPKRCRENITEIFESLAKAHFNAAMFQVRGAAETLYPSELEPWSPLIGGKDPGFDPVALAIECARRHGIAFHAYINPMPLRSAGAKNDPPANHLFATHGPGSPEPWVCIDRQGKPATSDYYYLSAGIPAVHAYIRSVIMDFVRRYDVDGVHLDRIRYPGPQYSQDPISRARFLARGNPELLDWADWQRHQLDKLVNDLAAEIRAEKPRVMLSCAAWGIYNRYHTDGYADFSSGYHDYYQDTWNWCRLGAMDALVPMIYWDLAEPKPNFDELAADFIDGIGAKRFIGGQRVFSIAENVREISFTRDADALGTVLWSYRSARRRGVLQGVQRKLYPTRVRPPVPDRVRAPRLGLVLGTVVDEDGDPVVDARVSLRLVEGKGTKGRRARVWTSGSDGRFAFLDVDPGGYLVDARYEGAPSPSSKPVRVRPGRTSRAKLVVRGATRAMGEPFLTILRPALDTTTDREVAHILGRAELGSRVTVGSERVETFATGAFARDNVPLKIGTNRIEVVAVRDGRRAARTLVVTRVEPGSPPPTSSLRILAPASDVGVQPGQLLTIRAEGPTGRSGHARFGPDVRLPLTEERTVKGEPTGTYAAVTRVPKEWIGVPVRIGAILDATESAPALESESEATVEVWDPLAVGVAETTAERTGITAGLHSVRLGGPWIAWVPAGTRFEVIGKHGRSLRVRLSESATGWVPERQCRILPPGTPVPHNFFTSCHVGGNGDHDTLSISLRAPVVVAVESETAPTNHIRLDFFNTHDALTWNSRKATASVIGAVRSEQIEPDRLRLTVPVLSNQIWGYWTESDGGTFKLHVRRPPAIADAPESPLTNLLIALEAGHGGSNSGAVGHFGTKEKDINLAAAMALQHELEARGARVVQLRKGDDYPSLAERAEKVNAAGADFLVSLHANSASSARGFLRVSGTSTYYHDVHCQAAAQLVYERLLTLGWDEFGVVGDFSYSPLRNTRVPAILVEQAFMSHPADEARLLDPAYQAQQASAIADGLAAFFDLARE